LSAQHFQLSEQLIRKQLPAGFPPQLASLGKKIIDVLVLSGLHGPLNADNDLAVDAAPILCCALFQALVKINGIFLTVIVGMANPR